MASVSSSEVARLVLDLATSRPPTLGGAGWLVCIDGPSGAGTSTLADAVAEASPVRTRVVRLDHMYQGWDGLPHVPDQLEQLLSPLDRDAASSYTRYDWQAGAPGEDVTVAPVPLLVLEGVGAGTARLSPLTTVLVWVDAPTELRRRRGVERDGDTFEPHWEDWAEAEAHHFERQGTRARADVLVDGTGRVPPRTVVPGAAASAHAAVPDH